MERELELKAGDAPPEGGRRPLSLPARLWGAHGLQQTFEAFGVRFALRFSAEVWLTLTGAGGLGAYVPCETVEVATAAAGATCFAVRRRPNGLAWRLLKNNRVLLERPDLETILHCLRGTLVGHVGERSPHRVFVHAGAVGWKGKGIVLPGDSFAGKTTLTAALVRAGATYYSDEIAVLDDEGLLHPYARALQMRLPGRPEQRTMKIEELRGTAGDEPLPVGLVVYSQYAEDAAWQLKPLTPGMAVMEAMRHTLPVRQAPGRVLQTWSKVAERALAWTWIRGDADEAAQRLLRSVETGTLPA